MAQQASPLSEPRNKLGYKTILILKGSSLGVGSYGSVFKVQCDDLVCAAKIIHPTLVPTSFEGDSMIREERLPINRFAAECNFLKELRHPNIIQYLGMYQDPDTGLPVLLMELMDESLTHFLEKATEPIPYRLQLSLSSDVACALSFLHSNDIVHRDLSSNNILLIAKSRAKITDFGMAKLVSTQTSKLSNTICPGTDVYMPPEAFESTIVFTDRGDVFSLGVNVLQILTRKFPAPGDRFKMMYIDHPQVPLGKIEVRASEVERRQTHINSIDSTHPLLPVALDCLKDQRDERPSSSKLCQRFMILKGELESLEEASKKDDTTELQQQEQPKHAGEDKLEQKLESTEQELTALQKKLEAAKQKLQKKDEVITAMEHQQKLNEEKIAQYQKKIENLQKFPTTDSSPKRTQQLTPVSTPAIKLTQPSDVTSPPALPPRESQSTKKSKQQLSNSRSAPWLTSKPLEVAPDPRLQAPLQARKSLPAPKPELQLPERDTSWSWKRGKSALCVMHRDTNAVVNGSTVYLRPYRTKKVYSYNSSVGLWSRLPDCLTDHATLAVVEGSLNTIGGTSSNKLFTLTRTAKTWMEKYPSMNTERSRCTAVTTDSILIVAGGLMAGQSGTQALKSVEVLNTELQQWSMAADLPQPLYACTSQMLNDYIYLFGGADKSFNETNTVISCSLVDLLLSCHSNALFAKISNLKLSRRPSAIWSSITDLPLSGTTCVTFENQLLAIGGRDTNNITSAAVHKFDQKKNSWQVVSHLNNARSLCFAAVLPNNVLMVMGGITQASQHGSIATDTVEFLTVE